MWFFTWRLAMASNPRSGLAKAAEPRLEQKGAEAVCIAVAFKNLIDGSVINLSGASEFYKRKAESATLLQDFVELLPNSHYRLKGLFDSWFFANLPVSLRNGPKEPGDALAEALFHLGRHWAKIGYGKLPMASIPSDDFLHNAWEGADEWGGFVKRDGCIGEAWLFTLGDNGTVRPWSGRPGPNDFELLIRFEAETKKPPRMKIEVKGKPASILMQFWMTLDPNSNPQEHPGSEALREKTEIVLDSMVRNLKTKLKILRPAKGRPSTVFGEHAAYLLDHQRKNIAWVAKELCQLPKDASPVTRRQCFDRIRTAANNYYKQIRSDYRNLKPMRGVRQRLIHLPPNSSSVKPD
jgi:hypothetical protein